MNKAIAEEITTAVLEEFNGRDPIKELSSRAKLMSPEELNKLVLVSANQIGTALKGEAYIDALDAAMFVSKGAEMLLNAYDNACMDVAFANGQVGTA